MNYPSSGPVKLRTNLAGNAFTRAIKERDVLASSVELDFVGPKLAHEGFKPMVREQAYDVGELAIVTVLQARAYDKPYVLLPAPVSGRFQHQCICYNAERGTLSPRDIHGRRVGVRTYAQTTGLWVRGILQHEYGVDLDKVTWLTLDDAHLSEHTDPDNCRRLPAGNKIDAMLSAGEIDAAILGDNERPDDPRLKPLIPEPYTAAREWFGREQVIPINHMFVVHRDLARQRPDVVRDLYSMLVRSRGQASAEARASVPPLGLEPNRKAIELAIEWSLEQKIIPRRLSVDELFEESTASLGA